MDKHKVRKWKTTNGRMSSNGLKSSSHFAKLVWELHIGENVMHTKKEGILTKKKWVVWFEQGGETQGPSLSPYFSKKTRTRISQRLPPATTFEQKSFVWVECTEQQLRRAVIFLIEMNRFNRGAVASGSGGRTPGRGGRKPNVPYSKINFDMFCIWCGTVIKNQVIKKARK